MDGWCEFKHEFEQWKPKKSSNSHEHTGDQGVDASCESNHLCLFALARSVRPLPNAVVASRPRGAVHSSPSAPSAMPAGSKTPTAEMKRKVSELKHAQEVEEDARLWHHLEVGQASEQAEGAQASGGQGADAAQVAPGGERLDEWPEFDAANLQGEPGARWPRRQFKNDPVNCNHTVEQLQDYMRRMQDLNLIGEPYKPEAHVPYENMTNFVATLTNTSNAVNRQVNGVPAVTHPPFKMNDQKSYRGLLATTLDLMPPGYFIAIENELKPPSVMLEEPSGGQGADGGSPFVPGQPAPPPVPPPAEGQRADGGQGRTEAQALCLVEQEFSDEQVAKMQKTGVELAPMHLSPMEALVHKDDNAPVYHYKDTVEDVYVGLPVESIPHVMAHGFKAYFGRGGPAMVSHYGFPTAGVYCTPSFTTAMQYPMMPTTGNVTLPGRDEPARYPGGTILALGGSCPLRCVAKCRADIRDFIWQYPRTNPTQMLYRCDSLTIRAFIVYAVDPLLAHHCTLNRGIVKSDAWNTETEEERKTRVSTVQASGNPFFPRRSYDDQWRGGFKMTLGDALAPPKQMPILDDLCRHHKLRKINDPLYDNLISADNHDETPLVASIGISIVSGVHHESHFLTKSILSDRIENFPEQIRVGTFQHDDVSARSFERILDESQERLQQMGVTGPLALEVSTKRGEGQRNKLGDKRKQNPDRAAAALMNAMVPDDKFPTARAKAGVYDRTMGAHGQVAGSRVVVGQQANPNAPKAKAKSGGGGQSADASRSSAKRDRKNQRKTEESDSVKVQKEMHDKHAHDMRKTFASECRIANACYGKLPVPFFAARRGMWLPPAPGSHFSESHKFELVHDKPTEEEIKQANQQFQDAMAYTKAVRRNCHDDAVRLLKLGGLSANLISPNDDAGNIGFIQQKVSYQADFQFGIPLVPKWFDTPQHLSQFVDAFVKCQTLENVEEGPSADPDKLSDNPKWWTTTITNDGKRLHGCNLFWKKLLANALTSHSYSNHIHNAPEYTADTLTDSNKNWISAIAQACDWWCYIRQKEPYKHDHEHIIKELSHVGGIFMDYVNTEFLHVGYRRVKEYKVILNYTYRRMLDFHKPRIIDAFDKMGPCERDYVAWHDTEIPKLNDEHWGDICEMSAAFALFTGRLEAVFELMDDCFVWQHAWGLEMADAQRKEATIPNDQNDPSSAFIEQAIKSLHKVRNYHKELFKNEPDKYAPQAPDPAVATYVSQLKKEASVPMSSASGDVKMSGAEASEPTPKAASDSESEIILIHPMMGGKEAYVPDSVEEDESRQLEDTLAFTGYTHGFRGGVIEKQDAHQEITAEAQQLLKWGLGKQSGDPAKLESAYRKYKSDGPLILSILKAPAAQQRAMFDAEYDDPNKYSKPVAFVPPSASSSSSQVGPLEMQAMMSPPATGGQGADGPAPRRKLRFGFTDPNADQYDSKGVKPETNTAELEKGLQDKGVMCYKRLHDGAVKEVNLTPNPKHRPPGASSSSSPNQYVAQGRTKSGGNKWVLAAPRRERDHAPDHGTVIDDSRFAAPEPLKLEARSTPGDPDTSYREGTVDLRSRLDLKSREEASVPIHDDFGQRILLRPELTGISKAMVKILRWRAKELRVEMDREGYVQSDVLADAITKHGLYGSVVRGHMIEQVVNNPPPDKIRYTFKYIDGELYVKAAQGHGTGLDIDYECDMTILNLEEAQQRKWQYVIHGTRFTFVNDILKYGLMTGGRDNRANKRVHIHFAVRKPHLGRECSGVRHGSDVAIYVDLYHAIRNGIPFYLSINNVVLTKGDNGVLSKAFFTKIVHLVTERTLWENGEWTRDGIELCSSRFGM